MKLLACAVTLVTLVFGCSSSPPNFSPSASDAGSAGGDQDSATKPSSCPSWPSGSVGTTLGKTVSADLSWKGFPAQSTNAAAIASTDLYDCDGSKGINAIIFDVSAEWCAACQTQAADQPKLAADYDALGVKVVTLIVQDASNKPATLATAESWKKQYKLTDIAVCADPQFLFQPSASGSVSLPMTVIVDPRTMIITRISQGYLAHYPLSVDADVVTLAKKNGAH